MKGLDNWIAGGHYKRYPTEVYCHNEACVDYDVATPVDYEEEYGAGWFTPEECPACGGSWHEDKPKGDNE